MRRCHFLFLLVLWLATSALPLEDFIANRDHFSWKAVKTEETANSTIHTLEVTSQEWGEGLVQEKTWKHTVKITFPKTLKNAVALFVVQGGKLNEPEVPTPEKLLEATLDTGTILVELKMVPNQPLRFLDEETSRIEDGLVARTWKLFLQKKDPKLPFHFPMAKAVVRGMDALEEFLKSKEIPLKGVILLGESKRAWAAWLAAAVDSRVKGIIPIVCDFLNLESCFKHQLRSLGAFSIATRPFTAEGIDEKCIGSRDFQELMELDDPYSYRARLTIPKFQINASGDPFSMPDSSRFSFSHLPQPKFLRYLPNAGHKFPSTSDHMTAAANFYRALVQRKTLPSFTWHRTAKNTLRIDAFDKPTQVKLWKATNPDARDFRYDFAKNEWTSKTVAEKSEGLYDIEMPTEEKGWAAYFAELEFDNGLTFTTEVFITPDTFPSKKPQ